MTQVRLLDLLFRHLWWNVGSTVLSFMGEWVNFYLYQNNYSRWIVTTHVVCYWTLQDSGKMFITSCQGFCAKYLGKSSTSHQLFEFKSNERIVRLHHNVSHLSWKWWTLRGLFLFVLFQDLLRQRKEHPFPKIYFFCKTRTLISDWVSSFHGNVRNDIMLGLADRRDQLIQSFHVACCTFKVPIPSEE